MTSNNDSEGMKSGGTLTPRIFSTADHLLLLQLATRKAVADRRAREESGSGKAAGSNDSSDGRPTEIPPRWRLLAESVHLYDWQIECLERWLPKARGTVKVATGGGKTLFAMAAAQRLQNERDPDLRLVVVVPTIPLMFQWRDELRASNLPESSIGLMGGGQELPPLAFIRVLICVLASARERLPKLIREAQWAEHLLLVVDECHRANAAQARNIFESGPKYTLGLSATPEQDAESEGMTSDESYAASAVGQALGEIIYDFSLRRSLDAGLLTPFEVWHIGLLLAGEQAAQHARLSRDISDLRKGLQRRHRESRSRQSFLAWCQAQASRAGTAAGDAERFMGLATQRKRLLYRADGRTRLTIELLKQSALDPDGRAIVFHESVDEIEKLFVEAQAAGLPVVLEHGKLPDGIRADNIEAFREGIAGAIISAKSLVEGFNVPSADLGVIAASTGAVRQRIQSLGRMLRRKAGGRSARIVVLYVRDTEDEALYTKADWESVLGAERNRYFEWNPPEPPAPWEQGLVETGKPPRVYRPPAVEVDVTCMAAGDSYPGQTSGIEIKVDDSLNPRTEDRQLVTIPAELVEAIIQLNRFRRARITPPGHLIVRVDANGGGEEDWRFLGIVPIPEEGEEHIAVRLRIRSVSGRRVISIEKDRMCRYAIGPEAGGSPEGGEARDRLLQWVATLESAPAGKVTTLFWDSGNRYWIERHGERIEYPDLLPPIEFAS